MLGSMCGMLAEQREKASSSFYNIKNAESVTVKIKKYINQCAEEAIFGRGSENFFVISERRYVVSHWTPTNSSTNSYGRSLVVKYDNLELIVENNGKKMIIIKPEEHPLFVAECTRETIPGEGMRYVSKSVVKGRGEAASAYPLGIYDSVDHFFVEYPKGNIEVSLRHWTFSRDKLVEDVEWRYDSEGVYLKNRTNKEG